MPTADSDWCWLMLTDTDWYWLSIKHQTHPAETYSQDCCCEKNIGRGEVKSCNPLLAKTTHKAMNRFFPFFLSFLLQKLTSISDKGTTAWWLVSLLKSLEPLATLSKTTSMCKSLLLIELIWLTSNRIFFLQKNGVKCLFNVHHLLPSGLLATWTQTFSPSSSSLVNKPYFCYKCIVFIQS